MTPDPLIIGADCADDGALHLDLPRRQYLALCRARFAGQRVEVEIRLRKSQRSTRANRLFWALLTPWAKELGYTPEELKDELLGLLWGWEERKSPLDGSPRYVPKRARSSKLNTADFAELIDFMVMKAAETGYVMTLPDDLRAKKGRAA